MGKLEDTFGWTSVVTKSVYSTPVKKFEYHIFNQNGVLSTVSVELSFVEDGVSSRPRE